MTEAKKDPVPVFVLKRLGGQAPEFDMPVDIKKLDGTPARLTLRCKALKKREWGAIKDKRQREAVEATLDASDAAAGAAAPAPAASAKASRKSKSKESPAPEVEVPADAAGLRDVVLRTLEENSIVGAVNEALKIDTALVLNFAIGWELEDEFNADALCTLEDEFAGALEAAMNAYDRAIFRGHVGNLKP